MKAQSTYKGPLTVLRSLCGCVRNRISTKLWFSGAASVHLTNEPTIPSAPQRSIQGHVDVHCTLAVNSC